MLSTPSPPPKPSFPSLRSMLQQGRSNLHITHVAFSPDGDEALVSYSGEHVYLFDLHRGTADRASVYTTTDHVVGNSLTPLHMIAPSSTSFPPRRKHADQCNHHPHDSNHANDRGQNAVSSALKSSAEGRSPSAGDARENGARGSVTTGNVIKAKVDARKGGKAGSVVVKNCRRNGKQEVEVEMEAGREEGRDALLLPSAGDVHCRASGGGAGSADRDFKRVNLITMHIV